MSVLQDIHGPDWPLGFIANVTPGTPVSIMSLVDPTGKNDPAASNLTGTTQEYTTRFQQIFFEGFKPNSVSGHGMTVNAGNVYIVRKSGSRDDTGTIIKVLSPGESFYLVSAPLNRNVFNGYRYYIDADTAGDGALVTGIVQ